MLIVWLTHSNSADQKLLNFVCVYSQTCARIPCPTKWLYLEFWTNPWTTATLWTTATFSGSQEWPLCTGLTVLKFRARSFWIKKIFSLGVGLPYFCKKSVNNVNFDRKMYIPKRPSLFPKGKKTWPSGEGRLLMTKRLWVQTKQVSAILISTILLI